VSAHNDRLSGIVLSLRRFVSERDWQRYHDPKNLAMLLASEAGELLAEYRWVSSDKADEYSNDSGVQRRINDEIGDVGIALVLLCDRLGVDLYEAIEKKIAVNAINYPVIPSSTRANERSVRSGQQRMRRRRPS
jgi:NTP pyrophosphatase (non-canonical NTP hydrolase)